MNTMENNKHVPFCETIDLTQDLEKMSFEDAQKQLEKIVSLLESGSVGLEDAIKYYEQGAKLHEYCANKLQSAQLKVQSIIHKDGKAIEAKDVDLMSPQNK